MPTTLDAAVVRRWCEAAVAALSAHRAEIDALNVFPVPDGDTGTNLLLTMQAALAALDGEAPTGGVDAAGRGLAVQRRERSLHRQEEVGSGVAVGNGKHVEGVDLRAVGAQRSHRGLAPPPHHRGVQRGRHGGAA